MPSSASAAPPRTASSLHALTWLAWAIAAAAAVQIAPNPVYVALVLAIAWLVVEVCSSPGPLRRAFPVLLGIGAVFGGLRVVLTALTTHGVSPAWFTLPEVTLPAILGGFTVGGPIERAVVLHAASEAFAIVVMIAVFGAFNACVSHAQLVRSAPRAFHEIGLVVTIAVAFVPSTIASLQAVREADRARTGGRVVRRGRLGRLTLPVLERGLEQAISLSESMDSRGFAREAPTPESRVAAGCGLASLLALTAAFVALVGRAGAVAIAALVVGAVLLTAALLLAGRSTPARYRRRPFAARDWGVTLVVILSPLALIGLALVGDASLAWNAWRDPSPTIAVAPLLALLPLLAPLAGRPRLDGRGEPGLAGVHA